MSVCRLVHSPEAVQGRDAVEEVCEPPPPEPSRFELFAGDTGIRSVLSAAQLDSAASAARGFPSEPLCALKLQRCLFSETACDVGMMFVADMNR